MVTLRHGQGSNRLLSLCLEIMLPWWTQRGSTECGAGFQVPASFPRCRHYSSIMLQQHQSTAREIGEARTFLSIYLRPAEIQHNQWEASFGTWWIFCTSSEETSGHCLTKDYHLQNLYSVKTKKSMKSKNNEYLWKNIQVVKRDSEIPGKADYCLVSFIVSFILHLKASPFWSRSSHSLLSATATAVASLRLASSSWKGGEERWQTSVPSSGHKHMLPIAGHGLAPKSPLCKMQDRGEWTHTLHKTSESPMKSKIWVILL